MESKYQYASLELQALAESLTKKQPANDVAKSKREITPSTNQLGAVTYGVQAFDRRDTVAITGRAGTGKTTTLIALRKRVPNALILSPSNKAVQRGKQVLREAGMSTAGCMTVSLAIETPVGARNNQVRGVHTPGGENENVEFSINQLARIDQPVIIDEGAMVRGELLEALEAACTGGIIVMGDHRQLPPIKGGDSLLTRVVERSGHYALTEVFRQSAGPLANSLDILLSDASVEEAMATLPKISIQDAIELSARSGGTIPILAAQHKAHINPLNSLVRKARGFGEELVPGETLLVRVGQNLSKYPGGFNLSTNEEVQFLEYTGALETIEQDGAVVQVRRALVLSQPQLDEHNEQKQASPNDRMLQELQDLLARGKNQLSPGVHQILICHFPGAPEQVAKSLEVINARKHWKGGSDVSAMAWIQRKYRETNPGGWTAYCDVYDSYARTVHSAQGSEWDHVVVLPKPIGDARKWLYTALSRAKKSAWVIDVATPANDNRKAGA